MNISVGPYVEASLRLHPGQRLHIAPPALVAFILRLEVYIVSCLYTPTMAMQHRECLPRFAFHKVASSTFLRMLFDIMLQGVGVDVDLLLPEVPIACFESIFRKFMKSRTKTQLITSGLSPDSATGAALRPGMKGTGHSYDGRFAPPTSAVLKPGSSDQDREYDPQYSALVDVCALFGAQIKREHCDSGVLALFKSNHGVTFEATAGV